MIMTNTNVNNACRMWKKKESKLELAATMIRKVMPEFQSREHVIILCDSWYTPSVTVDLPIRPLIGAVTLV